MFNFSFWAVNIVVLVASFIFKLGTLVMFTNKAVIFGVVGYFKFFIFVIRYIWAWAVNMADLVPSFIFKLATLSMFTKWIVICG